MYNSLLLIIMIVAVVVEGFEWVQRLAQKSGEIWQRVHRGGERSLGL